MGKIITSRFFSDNIYRSIDDNLSVMVRLSRLLIHRTEAVNDNLT